MAEMEGAGAAAASISAVLGDDDLLVEILLRVAFPTTLVRAALACKHWLSQARAPAFLRRFRRLHPPRLLGFYVVTKGTNRPRFLPLPQPPELAAVVRRASFDLDTLGCDAVRVDCWNGLLAVTFGLYFRPPMRMVRCPWYPARYTAILPPVPATSIHDGFTYYHRGILLSSSVDDLSYFCLAIGSKNQQTIVDVYVLQDDIWVIYFSAVSQVPKIKLLVPTLIHDDKIYNLALVSSTQFKLVLLDLASSCLSLVDLPEEVESLSAGLSLADDSAGVHLTLVKNFQLRIWLYRMDSNGVNNWFLVNTICLCEAFDDNTATTCMFEDVDDDSLKVHVIGVSSEFVFLLMDQVIYVFDIERKATKKVYEVTREDEYLCNVRPFMMVWPPKFPVMKEGCDRKE